MHRFLPLADVDGTPGPPEPAPASFQSDEQCSRGPPSDLRKDVDLPLRERYNLAADAGEATNLIGRDQARDRTLAGVLRGFSAANPSERLAEDADAAAKLRALGYVSGSPAPKR